MSNRRVSPPESFIGVSMERFEASLESDGLGPGSLGPGMDMVRTVVQCSLPMPPVSPAAPLSLAGAAWLPGGADRISALPDRLLRDIISRLPAADGARTAALASRWRPLWRSAPLVVADTHFLPLGVGEEDSSRVADLVTRVLAAHPGPFRCVHLTRTAMDAHRGEIARWLDVLAAKGVQELAFINRPWPLDIRLPATLFRCAPLTRLFLSAWRLPDTAAVPRSAAFPNLRELGLSLVAVEDRDLAFLLDRSPVLEILTVIPSQVPVRLRLVSHSVRCVQLCYSIVAEVLVVDAPRLESLLQSWGLGSKSQRCCRVKIGHAPKLRVIGYLQPGEHDLEIGNTSIKAGTKLTISTLVRSDLKKVPNFLRCFPNVETLHIQSEKACEEPTGKVGLKFWLEGGPITCIRQQLKKLIFREFRGSTNEVAFLKFVAEKARVLEKMVVVVYLSSGVGVSAMLKPLTCAKWANEACKLQVYKSIYSDGSRPVYGVRLASEVLPADPFDLKDYYESLL
ncbi:FBD-associated F-box protein At4g10400-like [Triticum urartu]|nr:FBD-associated F-box protein At4g10400-like [Triticum urartu]